MQSFDSAAEKRYFLVPRSRVRMLVDVDLSEIVHRFTFLTFPSSSGLNHKRDAKFDIRLYLFAVKRFEAFGLKALKAI